MDPGDLIKRPGQQSAPKKMTVDAEMVMLSYALRDNLTLGANVSYFQKQMESYKMGGSVTQTNKSAGIGDVDLSLRFNLWKDVYYSKFFTLLAGVTLPTGDFEQKYLSMPGLQNGTGTYTFTGGLLFSHRYENFWFHYQAGYTLMLENRDNYRFGDTTRIGAAVHYTPNYNFLVGLEIDGAYLAKDRYLGATVDDTGGYRSNLAGVAEWKFLTALGGTFSIRVLGGIPIYEDLNHYLLGPMEKAKLGGGYFATTMISFNKRF